MNNEKKKFWAGCPYCKKKFGVEPKYIMMYLRRIIDDHKNRLGAMEEMLAETQEEIEAEKKKHKWRKGDY